MQVTEVVQATLPYGPRASVCKCGKPVFFRNSQCLACGAPLGYEPRIATVNALERSQTDDVWRIAGERGSARYRRCSNLSVLGCNWLVDVTDDESGTTCLCRSCRLDRTIPDLSEPANVEAMRLISNAKRRLTAALISLGLPLASKLTEDSQRGLAFDFLRSPQDGPPIVTGHSDGIITMDVAETEDATRERIRHELHEPYRTVLGHLRHETGHYYWDRLVAETDWIEEFRRVFGDEQAPYQTALEAHYQNGPVPDWQQRFVSAYASAHPWEDWAESWAHYLHIVDTFATAVSFGIDREASIDVLIEPFTSSALYDPNDPDAAEFLRFMNAWIRLTAPLNELSRGMGLADFYPFVLSRSAVSKLHFIHTVIARMEPSAPDKRLPEAVAS